MDSRIITRLKIGGAEELTNYFMEYRQHLRDVINCRINAKLVSRIDASDIVQETYIRACNALSTYLKRPAVPPLVWLRRLGKQVLSENHRKNFRTIRSPLKETTFGEPDLMEQFLIDSMASSRSIVEKTETAFLVRKLINDLNECDREIIEMRHVEGHRISEIAKLLDLSLEATKKRYQRAIKRFRDLVEGKDGLAF